MNNKDEEDLLNPSVIKSFLTHFNFRSSDIKILSGSLKHVIVEFKGQKVFIFPKNNKRALELFAREILVLDYFKEINIKNIPKLITKFKIEKINIQEFVETTYIKGVSFSLLINEGVLKDIIKVLISYSKEIANIHKINYKNIPKMISLVRPKHVYGNIDENASNVVLDLQNCIYFLLDPVNVIQAVEFLYNHINSTMKNNKYQNLKYIESQDTINNWKRIFKELSNLDKVFLHSDMNQGQILYEPGSLKVTGIVDWSFACIGNPIWDFNFRYWNDKFWSFQDHFSKFATTMWESYLNKRNINLSSLQGLNLFNFLWYYSQALLGNINHRPVVSQFGIDHCLSFCLDNINLISARIISENNI